MSPLRILFIPDLNLLSKVAQIVYEPHPGTATVVSGAVRVGSILKVINPLSSILFSVVSSSSPT